MFGASEEYVNEVYGMDNKIIIYDRDLKTTSYKLHNLGHCNSVDYCSNADVLLTTDVLGYETARGRKAELVLYKNPLSRDTLLKKDAIIIPLYKQSNDGNLASFIYAQFVWGESDDILYGFEYHYYGKNAYKLQLGKGNIDYSLEYNGYGSFIKGCTEDEYNGTCLLLKTYKGTIMEGIDTEYVINSSYIPGAQGMCYDGYLYICWGTLGGKSILKILFDDEKDTYRVVNNYSCSFMDDSGCELFMEPEAIMINKPYAFAGFRNANDNIYNLISFVLN